MLARIVRMVAEAQRSRAPIQAVTDRISGWFVPLVVLIAVLTFVVWNLIGPESAFGHALLNAIAVLIIACPCALGLTTPMSVMVCTGRGAHAGVLIKNAEALQALEKVDTLVIEDRHAHRRPAEADRHRAGSRSRRERTACRGRRRREPLGAPVRACDRRGRRGTRAQARFPGGVRLADRARHQRTGRRSDDRDRQCCANTRPAFSGAVPGPQLVFCDAMTSQ